IAEAASASLGGTPSFPLSPESYQDGASASLGEKLLYRAKAEPFNVLATSFFILAVLHTFLASRFMAISHRYHHSFEALQIYEEEPQQDPHVARKRDKLQFRAQLFHFMGEVEAVFGIWLIPLCASIVVFHGWGTMVSYFDQASFAEPVFVAVIMAIAASRPVLRFAEACLARVASLGNGRPVAWWLSILTVGPLLGSFITEPAAMTICALLLGQRFYVLNPSSSLKYATLGLLFVNVSVGGTLTHFAAPPIVMVAKTWGWDTPFMLGHFGWKAATGILAANALYFLCFRGELLRLTPTAADEVRERPIPIGLTLTHLTFIAWTVLNAHHPSLVVLGFLFFLAFVQATERHQSELSLRGPMLVGFFLAALVLHGGCQQWWIAPVLSSLTKWPLMLGATALTAVNDNAAITYLASLVPGFSDELKQAVVAGAVAGGGLTVIANAPNPAGQSILQRYFGEAGISPLRLLGAALLPTIIVGAALMLLPS
ncbi:MAG TPA: putative Na+/H+ antiporter, partial [Chthoniobacteraceae bacterium]